MDTKTYEVKIKALKTAPSVDVGLSVLRQGKIIAKKGKFFEADFDSILLTNEKHKLYDIYGSAISQPSWTKVPDKLKVKPGTTNLENVFLDCKYLEEIDVSNFDTSSATTMLGMFKNFGYSAKNTPCIKGLDKLDTSNVTNMQRMFSGSGLAEIDLRSWDTSKVTTMYEMFRYCEKLEVIDFSGIDTSKVTNFSLMFDKCNNLREVRGVFDLSSSYGTAKSLEFTQYGKKPPKLEKPIQLKNVPRELYIYDNGGMFEILSYKEN